MARVLWIGGPPGAGKTTVARRLARRHGLRLYSSDTRTWPHRDRAVAAGNPAAIRWERLRPADDWTGVGDADQLAMSLHAERGPMVLEDLAALPPAPLVVAEGSVLPAAAAARDGAGRAVWLQLSGPLQDERLGGRGEPGGRLRLQAVLRDEIEREAREHGVPTLAVEPGTGPEDTLAAVEARFADALAAGPRAATRAERQALLREANLAVVHQVRHFHARSWATGTPHERVVAFACECGDPACTVDFTLPADEHPSDRLLLAAGHHAPEPH